MVSIGTMDEVAHIIDFDDIVTSNTIHILLTSLKQKRQALNLSKKEKMQKSNLRTV